MGQAASSAVAPGEDRFLTADADEALQHTFQQRKLRANELLDRHPHAEQILIFYINLLEIQEPLGREALAAPWAKGVVKAKATPPLRLEQLPIDDILSLLRRFLGDLRGFGTGTVNAVAGKLARADPALLVRLLQRFSAGESCDDLARELEAEPLQIGFFPRALLQPIAEAFAAKVRIATATRQHRRCPTCGRLPQVTFVRDEPEIKGRRFLTCSLCGTHWPYPRSTCAACGETNTDNIVYHASDTLLHLRVEECLTCRTYIKSVDLRQDGRAISVVDEIASVELDVWAEERGLRKIERNVVGL